jgi:endonuclease YncB( thermonuclease family)
VGASQGQRNPVTFGEAEVEAREKLLGLWKAEKPVAPWEWRMR